MLYAHAFSKEDLEKFEKEKRNKDWNLTINGEKTMMAFFKEKKNHKWNNHIAKNLERRKTDQYNF